MQFITSKEGINQNEQSYAPGRSYQTDALFMEITYLKSLMKLLYFFINWQNAGFFMSSKGAALICCSLFTFSSIAAQLCDRKIHYKQKRWRALQANSTSDGRLKSTRDIVFKKVHPMMVTFWIYYTSKIIYGVG